MTQNINLGNYPLFFDYCNALQGSDSTLILDLFDRLWSYDVPQVNMLLVEGIVFKSYKDRNTHSLMMHLGNVVIRDQFREDRINILAHLPRHLTFNHNVAKALTLSIATMVLERNETRFNTFRNMLANDLLGMIHSETVGKEGSYDRRSVEVLRYVEDYVNPDWNAARLRLTNEFYSVMAKRVCFNNIDEFMETVMESDTYSYHSMMVALTPAALSGFLTNSTALKFMQEKHDFIVRDKRFGVVNQKLKDKIEVQFILALVSRLTVYDIEKLMKTLEFEAIMKPEVLEEIARIHIEDLHKKIETIEEKGWLIFLTRQVVLAKYCSCDKNRILKHALRLFDVCGVEKEVQSRVFCSVVASSSYPKSECNLTGDLPLFHFLFKRLMKMLPKLDQYDLMMEFNRLQTVLYSIHSLYKIDRNMHKVMREIDPIWIDRVSHAIDLLIMSSRCLTHKINCIIEDVDEKRNLENFNKIVTDTGKLLAYLLGTLNKKDLDLRPLFLSTDSFTKKYTGYLSIDEVPSDPPLRFDHREVVAKIKQLDAEDDAEDDADSDDDNDEEDEVDEEENDDDETNDTEDSGMEDSTRTDSAEEMNPERLMFQIAKMKLNSEQEEQLKQMLDALEEEEMIQAKLREERTASQAQSEILEKIVDTAQQNPTRGSYPLFPHRDFDTYSEYTIHSPEEDDIDEEEILDGFDENSDLRRALRLAAIRHLQVEFDRELFITYDARKMEGMVPYTSTPTDFLGDIDYQRVGKIGLLLGDTNLPSGFYAYPLSRSS